MDAFAAADLTQRLEPRSAPVTEFADDELGRLMRHLEAFRGAVAGSYQSYNSAAQELNRRVAQFKV